jgi:hypothetical protein
MSPQSPFSEWQNFYMIMASAAAALTGLQFVAMALVAEIPMSSPEVAAADADAGTAFSTPSVVHFGLVLLLAAVMVMPWRDVTSASIVVGLLGLCGLFYVVHATKLLARQKSYKPVLEDWILRAVMPFAAYLLLAICSQWERFSIRAAIFGMAFAALSLMFVGIYGAWDNVTYIVSMKRQGKL